MFKNLKIHLCFLLILFFGFVLNAQKKDDILKKATKELPLEPERNISFTTDRGTWISLDVSPDGSSIVFDLMGDIYSIPIAGGKATKITSGMAYDVHPRYSPDGESIVFISDKSGSDNIWTLDLKTKEDKQITKDKKHNFFSAEWTVDGDYIIGVKGRRNIKPHIYHKDGGSGSQLVSKPENIKLIDPAVSPDGKLVYFSQRRNSWNYNAQLPQYQIGTYDLEDGDVAVVTSRYGSAFTPTLSPNGQWLVYGTRFEAETGLVLRNLKTGDERWLAYPVQRDEQESIAPLGVLPAMSFTPDSNELIASYGGKIYSISILENTAKEIPFSVDVNLDMGPRLSFKYPISDDVDALATQIRDAKPSPDGSKLAFTALNRLYVMEFPNGTPKRVTQNNFIEAQPAWSPDGKYLIFTTWQEKEGGHLFKINVEGRPKAVKLTKTPGIYTYPEWSYTSNRIAFHRGSAQSFKDQLGLFSSRNIEDLVWITADGGPINLIDKSKGRQMPHFTKIDDRVYLSDNDKGLISIRWDGSDEKEVIKLKGIITYGSQDALDIHSNLHQNPEADKDKSSKPRVLKISPNGDEVLAQINNDIYVATIPRYGKTPTVSVSKVENAAFPAMKLTSIGGEFPTWSNDSKTVHWSLGATHFKYNVLEGKHFKDSIAETKKKQKAIKEAETKKDSTLTKDEEKDDVNSVFRAEEYKVKVFYLSLIHI